MRRQVGERPLQMLLLAHQHHTPMRHVPRTQVIRHQVGEGPAQLPLLVHKRHALMRPFPRTPVVLHEVGEGPAQLSLLVHKRHTLMLPFLRTPVVLHQVGEGPVQLLLELGVRDDKVRVVAPAREADPLVGAGVQLVEAREHVPDVEDGPAGLVDPVEHVVAEELEGVPVAVLGPARVVVELLPLVDHAQLHEQAHDAAVLELPLELAGEHVGVLQVLVEALDHVVGHARDELVGALFAGRQEEPLHQVAQRRFSLGAGLVLPGDGGHFGVQVDQLVCQLAIREAQNQPPQLDKVVLLELLGGPVRLELDHVEDGARGQSNSTLVGDDDFARVETAGGEVPRVYGPEGVGDLDDIGPNDGLGDLRRRTRAAVPVVLLRLCQVDFNEGLRQRKVVLGEDERPVAKRRGGEGIVHKDDIPVVYLFPLLDGLDGLGGLAVAQAEILDPPQAVNPTRLCGEGLEEPTRPAKDARVLAVRRIDLVEWDEGMVVFQLDGAGYDLEGGVGFLLQVLSEVVGHEEVAGLALVWQQVLSVGSYVGIKMVWWWLEWGGVSALSLVVCSGRRAGQVRMVVGIRVVRGGRGGYGGGREGIVGRKAGFGGDDGGGRGGRGPQVVVVLLGGKLFDGGRVEEAFGLGGGGGRRGAYAARGEDGGAGSLGGQGGLLVGGGRLEQTRRGKGRRVPVKGLLALVGGAAGVGVGGGGVVVEVAARVFVSTFAVDEDVPTQRVFFCAEGGKDGSVSRRGNRGRAGAGR